MSLSPIVAEDTGSVDCFPCSPGKYARLNASTACTDCPSGWIQETEGQPNCIKPDAGKIAAGGSSSVAIAKGWEAFNCNAEGVCNKTRACRPGTSTTGRASCLAGRLSSTEADTVRRAGKYAKREGKRLH